MAQLLRLVLIASAASFADGIKLSANPASCQRVQCTKSQRIVMKGSSRFRKELAAMDDWEFLSDRETLNETDSARGPTPRRPGVDRNSRALPTASYLAFHPIQDGVVLPVA